MFEICPCSICLKICILMPKMDKCIESWLLFTRFIGLWIENFIKAKHLAVNLTFEMYCG